MARKIIEDVYGSRGGFLAKYRRIRVGDGGWFTLFAFELVTMLFGNLPGALGLFLRGKLLPPFFRSVGRGVVFGAGITLRNPGAIEIGDKVILDDLCVLDAKGEGGDDKGIRIGSRCFISRNVLLGCKNGRIEIGDGVSIGPNSTIHSVEESHVTVGNDVVMAAYTYVIGAPNYRTARGPVPMARQGFEPGKGVKLGGDIWIGAGAVISDGSTIGEGAIIGAQSLVRGEIPPYAFAYGTPAAVRGERREAGSES